MWLPAGLCPRRSRCATPLRLGRPNGSTVATARRAGQDVTMAAGRPVVFLDRDGTLIEEVGYVNHPSRVRLLPGAADAVARLRAAGHAVVVVTNQAGIAR